MAARAVVCIGAAAALVSFRIVPVPGIEFYLAPVIYLAVAQVWGLRAGILAAAITMLPTVFWWGHGYSIALAVAHVAFVSWRRTPRLAAEATVLFALTIGVVGGFAILRTHYDAPWTVAAIVVGRKALNDILCAAIVDFASVRVRVDRKTLRVHRRPSAPIGTTVRTMMHLTFVVMTLASAVAAGRVYSTVFTEEMRRREEAFRQLAPELEARLRPAGVASPVLLPVGALQVPVMVAATVGALQESPPAGVRCSRIDASIARVLTRPTFDQQIGGCTILRSGREPEAYALVRNETAALRGYREAALVMAPTLICALLAAVPLAYLARRLRRGSSRWHELMGGFGDRMPKPVHSGFYEFDAAATTFVEMNNAYVESRGRAEQFRRRLAQLRGSINLRLVQNVVLDAKTSEVAFDDLQDESAADRQTARFLPPSGELPQGSEPAPAARLLLELPPAGVGRPWRLLLAEARRPDGSFASGLVFDLHEPRFAREAMLHRFRLAQVGTLAAATIHEIRQPLFFVGVQAEVAADSARKRGEVDLAELFDLIGKQVERAQAITQRMSRFVARETQSSNRCAVVDCVEGAVALMSAQASARDVRLLIDRPSDFRPEAPASQLSLEQVLVNAISNAIDSIAADNDRPPGSGVVTVRLTRQSPEWVMLEICDDGKGLPAGDPDSLFDPFVSNKPVGAGTGLGLYICRELAAEWGGVVSLTPGSPRGAVFRIELPVIR